MNILGRLRDSRGRRLVWHLCCRWHLASALVMHLALPKNTEKLKTLNDSFDTKHVCAALVVAEKVSLCRVSGKLCIWVTV